MQLTAVDSTRPQEHHIKRCSGTSIATPIAAATASIFLEFLRAHSANTPGDHDLVRAAALLNRTNGMRIVLRSIAQRKGNIGSYQFIAPWYLLDNTRYKPQGWAETNILGALAMEYEFG